MYTDHQQEQAKDRIVRGGEAQEDDELHGPTREGDQEIRNDEGLQCQVQCTVWVSKKFPFRVCAMAMQQCLPFHLRTVSVFIAFRV